MHFIYLSLSLSPSLSQDQKHEFVNIGPSTAFTDPSMEVSFTFHPPSLFTE